MNNVNSLLVVTHGCNYHIFCSFSSANREEGKFIILSMSIRPIKGPSCKPTTSPTKTFIVGIIRVESTEPTKSHASTKNSCEEGTWYGIHGWVLWQLYKQVLFVSLELIYVLHSQPKGGVYEFVMVNISHWAEDRLNMPSAHLGRTSFSVVIVI